MNEAYSKGFSDYLNGKPKSNNPYPEMSRDATEYRVGWSCAAKSALSLPSYSSSSNRSTLALTINNKE